MAETILAAALKLFRAPRGALFLGRAAPTGFNPIAAKNLSREDLSIVGNVCGVIGKHASEGVSLVIEDAHSDARLESIAATLPATIRSMLWVSLSTPSGRLGALYLDSSSPGAFRRHVLPLAELVGGTAAAFLETTRIHEELVRENTRLRCGPGPKAHPFDRLIGSSEVMATLRRQASIAALMERPLFILGEPGSGRRLLARTIHDASLRAGRPFVACDCSVVRRRLLKQALFGYPTGAAREEPGLIRLADRGTLYLTNAQILGGGLGGAVALIAETGAFRPKAARRDARIDVRVILSSDGEWAEEGSGSMPRPRPRFPVADWFRLEVPPLRERLEDIPDLVVDMERTLLARRETRQSATFTDEALRVLQAQSWPGNVRELRQVVQRVILGSAKSVIDAGQVRHCLNPPPGGAGTDWGPWPGRSPSLAEWESAAVRHALKLAKGNKSRAARLLRIHRNTLVRKLKALKEQSLPASESP